MILCSISILRIEIIHRISIFKDLFNIWDYVTLLLKKREVMVQQDTMLVHLMN
jgi:hypothetical protein